MPLAPSAWDLAEDYPSESSSADFMGGVRRGPKDQLFSALLSLVVPVDTALGEGNAIISIVTSGVPSATTVQPSTDGNMGQILSWCTLP